MSDYIKREDVILLLEKEYEGGWIPYNTKAIVKEQIECIPSADVVERGVMEQDIYERDVAEKQLAEIGKCIGERMDDVVERKKGTWGQNINSNYSPFDGSGEYLYQCSKCKCIQNRITNFCPNCGADMRQKEET